MPWYRFSLNDDPSPSDEFALDLPDDAAATREAVLAREKFWGSEPNGLVCVNIWDESGRRVAQIATANKGGRSTE